MRFVVYCKVFVGLSTGGYGGLFFSISVTLKRFTLNATYMHGNTNLAETVCSYNKCVCVSYACVYIHIHTNEYIHIFKGT